MAKSSLCNLEEEGGFTLLKINPEIYPIDVIFSAAYVLLDQAYIIFDGDRHKEIIVKIKPKGDQDAQTLCLEFYNEMINYKEYEINFNKNKDVRDIILHRALLTNDSSLGNNEDDELEDIFSELDDSDDDFLDDPEGIAIPWEEKYNKSDIKSVEQENKNGENTSS